MLACVFFTRPTKGTTLTMQLLIPTRKVKALKGVATPILEVVREVLVVVLLLLLPLLVIFLLLLLLKLLLLFSKSLLLS